MSTEALKGKKKIVVIGYGAAGSQFTAKIAKGDKYHVTVLTPFEYQEVSLLMTKVIAEGDAEHAKAIYEIVKEPGVEYVIDVAESISNGVVSTRKGHTLPFDVCVIATGQNIKHFYPDLADSTTEARKKTIHQLHEQVERANSIVIAGGGPVGTEAAADIKLRHKNKEVTVVFPEEHILGMMSPQFQTLSEAFFAKANIHLRKNDRVVSHENGVVKLKSGSTIPCDLFIPAHSTGGNSSFLPAGSVDERHYIKVDNTFKVEGFSNVFAFGDCSNYDRIKTYPKIEDQMPTLLFNVENQLLGKPLKHHIKGKSMQGSFQGPLMVAFGHGLDDGYGVGPDIPGCCAGFLWLCCFCGPPCSHPAGHGVNKIKTDFNYSITPKLGMGMAR